ncbi:MAG: adenosylcobalamin-dependent ribonucleoside-diphosphate reductase, partial [Planctomycetota bacterium]|nr:adenosylcobalamin-dependent ribonucleoside-diphosphate reductase [Planctomycetota bacterium]
KPGQDVFAAVEWDKRTSRITGADGKVVFEMHDVETPKRWSQLATDIMVSKYFRKAGVPQFNDDGTPKLDEKGNLITSAERSAQQVIHRMAGCWRHWGEQYGYFDSADDAEAFYDELAHMLLDQMAAPNSPQWFNTGLNWAYGITGPAQGHWVPDPATGEAKPALDAYSHPQPHACFIQSIRDDLVSQGGIMDVWVREARLFKYGSGTGTNFSSLRGENEPLSGGGKSSGLMSFLRIGDRAAGAIKSGGTTRRAAKMVCLNVDHPDIEAFVNWKVREELKVAAMVEGLKHLPPEQQKLAEKTGLVLGYDFNGEAYLTVSGQNSNNSVRLPDSFFAALDADSDWNLIRRTDGRIAKTMKARELWEQICFAAWRCADPGVQYDTTINAWHTCPASGRINASNPCSEYMFLDNTACNLASINLIKFYDAERRTFDVDGFEHAIRLWTIVLEISVLMACYPSKEIAEQSWRFRTLGLGYANLGAMLMQAGIPYDSDEARALCGAITATLTGRAYATSAEMARQLQPFPGFAENREPMLRVIRNHRRAAYGVRRDSDDYEGLPIRPVPIDRDLLRAGRSNIANAEELLNRATLAWDDALQLGEKFGYRNAQTTVIAPTGTIGLLMDCDTTGGEPDFALTKFKKLAGGGYFKIANQSLRPALRALGYETEQLDDILTYVMGTLSLDTPMPKDGPHAGMTFREFLADRGYRSQELVQLENHLPAVFELGFAFTAWSMPEHVLASLGIDTQKARGDGSFNGLRALGLSGEQIDALNQAVCGTQTVESAPHLRPEHLPVFDCASTCGKLGKRFIAATGHIRMMAAAQPFISGAISKTINLPANAAVEGIADAYRLSWELGLKANALYRDGSKLSQPLSTKAEVKMRTDEENHAQAVEAALGEASTAAVEAAPAMSISSTSSESRDTPPVVTERIVDRPLRRRLPDTRASITHRFNVAGHEGYLTVGLYTDGSPGELFITMAKEGSTIGGLMDCLGIAISVALQYGVPIESLVNKFTHQRFEPMGMTTNSDIPFAKSLLDYIFRWLGMEFLPGYREENIPKRRTVAKKAEANQNLPSSPADQNRAWSAIEPSTHSGRPVTIRATPNGAKERDDQQPPAQIDGPSSTTSTAESQPRDGQATNEQTTAAIAAAIAAASTVAVAVINPLDRANAALMGDAPACDVCGSITVRNGNCYKCMNCGNSMGCS